MSSRRELICSRKGRFSDLYLSTFCLYLLFHFKRKEEDKKYEDLRFVSLCFQYLYESEKLGFGLGRKLYFSPRVLVGVFPF